MALRISSGKRDCCLAAAIVCLLLLVTLGLRITNYAYTWSDDFAGYILQAQAIVNGTIDQTAADMIILHPSPLPDAALSDPPRLYYVWGLPMLLLPFVQNAAESIPEMLHSMKWINCICISGIAGIGYLFFRRRFGAMLSFGLAAVLSSALFASVNTINTDVPELLFAFLSFYLYELTTDHEKNWLLPVLLGAAMYCTCSIRLNGYTVVAFIGLATLADCVRARKFSFLRLLPFLTAGLLYGLQLCILPAPTSNLSDLKGGFTLKGLYYSVEALAYVGLDLLKVRHGLGNLLITTALCGLGVIGTARSGGRKELRYALFFLATFLVLAALPYTQGSRYYMNTYPVILLMIGYGAREALEYGKRKFPRLCKGSGFAAASLVLVMLCTLYSAMVTRNWQSEVLMEDAYSNSLSPISTSAYQYIQENTPEDAVVAYFTPRLMRLFTGRMSFALDSERLPLENADYYLTYKGVMPEPEILERLEPVYENPDMILFRVIK